MMPFLAQHLDALLLKTWEQIYLVLIALALALIIGVPLGIFIARRQKIKTVVLGIASLLQTIPSLALLALLLPFFGIGIKPAIIALSIYAFLPIIRNTVTGIHQVSADMVEAANAIGFTPWQKLWHVELPLAMPVLIAGIRTATAMCMGIATLAAFIGAGGLGDFIYQGLSLDNQRLILLGAIPVAMLALIFDYLIYRIELFISKRRHRQLNAWLKYVFLAALLAILVCIFALSYYFYHGNKNQDSVIIGSKNFTEQYILGELAAIMLKTHSHLHVMTKLNLGGTLFCQQALKKGEIDLYPEYTGTAFTVILKQKNPSNAEAVYRQVKQDYRKRFNLIWLPPLGFNNTQAVAVRSRFAKAHQLTTLSQLSAIAPNLTAAVPGDCLSRPDCFPGLKKRYHLAFKQIKLMTPTLMYPAIYHHQVDVIMAFSTDGRIKAYHLRLLQDDKHLFPPYFAAYVLNGHWASKHPKAVAVLRQLSDKISNSAMQAMNYAVDVKKQSPHAVAEAFLRQQHLIPNTPSQ